jgi:hypothetical protein
MKPEPCGHTFEIRRQPDGTLKLICRFCGQQLPGSPPNGVPPLACTTK